MNQQLLSQVMASCVYAPDWLMKKRQLAVLLQERFKSTPATEKIIAAWLENPSLAQLEQSVGEQANADQVKAAVPHTTGWVNLPLFAAANVYPELLQENLMEKAISWQDSQLNAMHLALLNGGRFIYIPDGTIVKEPIEPTAFRLCRIIRQSGPTKHSIQF